MGVNVFMFHLMPYGDLPASNDGPAWVTCPNSLYDPARGHELYNRYVDELPTSSPASSRSSSDRCRSTAPKS